MKQGSWQSTGALLQRVTWNYYGMNHAIMNFHLERIFQARTANYLNMADGGLSLPAPLYFKDVENLTVAEIEDCLEACTARTDGSCQGFYLATDGIACHVGSFVSRVSGLGVLVSDAVAMFSVHKKAIGMVET